MVVFQEGLIHQLPLATRSTTRCLLSTSKLASPSGSQCEGWSAGRRVPCNVRYCSESVSLPTFNDGSGCINASERLRSIPGYKDRALTPAARVRMFVTWTAVLGGLTAGLMMVYRTFLRPNGILGSWGSVGAILGRREL